MCIYYLLLISFSYLIILGSLSKAPKFWISVNSSPKVASLDCILDVSVNSESVTFSTSAYKKIK